MRKKRRSRDRLERIVRALWGGYRRGGVNGAYHWLRCHVWNRFHIIDISGEDWYDWGWIDRDHAMLLACFKLLRDYVEKEDPRVGLVEVRSSACTAGGCTSLGDNPIADDTFAHVHRSQLDAAREVRALYDWWTIDRPRELEAIDPADWHTRQLAESKDDEMLMRLMKVRRYLWT